MTDNITLPRSVVEQTLDAMTDTALGAKVFGPKVRSSLNALRAALKHPDAGPPATAPEGWRLVPVVPTREMIEAGKDAHYEAEKRIQEPDAWSPGGFAKRAVRATHVFQAMLAAAPHPPEHYDQQALDLCPTCGWKTMIPGDCCLICARQKPQVEQEPVAWVWFDANKKPCSVTFGGPNINTPKDWGVSPLYTRPQPKREPLTDERLDAIVFGCGLSRTARDIARATEAAHDIKDES